MRDCDKISMQKVSLQFWMCLQATHIVMQSSTANEIDQINLQINELLSKRQTLEQKWEKLEEKDIQLQLISKCVCLEAQVALVAWILTRY